MESEEVILAVLTLIDLSLAGNLLLIVLFSGYENFVSKFDLDRARPAGLDGHRRLLRPQDEAGRLDRGDLGDQPAQAFMEVGEYAPGKPIDEPKLFWMVIIHLTFVASGVLLAVMDWVAAKTDKH